MKNERSFKKMNIDFAKTHRIPRMSYFSGTFPKKFCGSDDHRPSNKPEPLYNDFWGHPVALYLYIMPILTMLLLKS